MQPLICAPGLMILVITSTAQILLKLGFSLRPPLNIFPVTDLNGYAWYFHIRAYAGWTQFATNRYAWYFHNRADAGWPQFADRYDKISTPLRSWFGQRPHPKHWSPIHQRSSTLHHSTSSLAETKHMLCSFAFCHCITTTTFTVDNRMLCAALYLHLLIQSGSNGPCLRHNSVTCELYFLPTSS